MYYGLDNFYQNHRRYVKSRDDSQLLGNWEEKTASNGILKNCYPFDRDPNNGNKTIIPCGAIANSLFSDVITLEYKKEDGTWTPVPVFRTGIAWDSDKNYKFSNPTDVKTLDDLKKALEKYTKPKDWKVLYVALF